SAWPTATATPTTSSSRSEPRSPVKREEPFFLPGAFLLGFPTALAMIFLATFTHPSSDHLHRARLFPWGSCSFPQRSRGRRRSCSDVRGLGGKDRHSTFDYRSCLHCSSPLYPPCSMVCCIDGLPKCR